MPEFDEDLEESTAILSVAALGLPSMPPVSRHVLVRMDGSEAGKVISLGDAPEFLVGRRADCDLVLQYAGVSRKHARILNDGPKYYVEDLGSSNGTIVSGQTVRKHLLRDGDVLQFGPNISVRYSVTDTKEEGMLRRLYEASVRDSLTGAYNREFLSERLKSEVSYAKRHGTESSLIMFDLDHFKQVNDTYGHPAGDQVLVDVVKRATVTLRAEDVLARYGGEEFVVSMRGITLEGAAQLGERLRQSNHRRVVFEGQDIPITISVGCATVSECDGEPTPEELIAIADRRLYAAKRGGRNRVVVTG